jgi:outer membrane receptor protein involved in Fe transport
MLMQAKFKASCAVFALLSGYAGAAYAQDAATDSVGLQEVVVTAQRRTESVQNVPNTIQAFSGLALDQLDVVSFNDLIKLTPNVTFGSAGPGSGNIFMRGLSSGFANNQSSATIGSFPNVAVYLDDQSLTFPYRNVDVYVVDMERVEVLEGPQGTLFGGGAEAGAVRYITNKPKLNEFSGYAEVSGGSTAHGDGNYAGNLTVNVPVVQDVFAVRAVIYDDRRGGYIDNVPSTFTRKSTDYGPKPGHLYRRAGFRVVGHQRRLEPARPAKLSGDERRRHRRPRADRGRWTNAGPLAGDVFLAGPRSRPLLEYRLDGERSDRRPEDRL